MNCSLSANALPAPPRPNTAIASAVNANAVLTLTSSSLRPRCNRALLRQRLRGQPTRRNLSELSEGRPEPQPLTVLVKFLFTYIEYRGIEIRGITPTMEIKWLSRTTSRLPG